MLSERKERFISVRIGNPRLQKGRGFLFVWRRWNTPRQKNCPPADFRKQGGGIVPPGIQNHPGRDATKPPLPWSMGSLPPVHFHFSTPSPLSPWDFQPEDPTDTKGEPPGIGASSGTLNRCHSQIGFWHRCQDCPRKRTMWFKSGPDVSTIYRR